MQEVKIKITNKNGIHARPSDLIAEVANSFPNCKIKLISENGKKADARSVIEIIILGVSYKEKIKIIANGKDEKLAMDKLVSLFKSNFRMENKKS